MVVRYVRELYEYLTGGKQNEFHRRHGDRCDRNAVHNGTHRKGRLNNVQCAMVCREEFLKMTTEQAIYQLTDLIRDRESFCHRDDFDIVIQADVKIVFLYTAKIVPSISRKEV